MTNESRQETEAGPGDHSHKAYLTAVCEMLNRISKHETGNSVHCVCSNNPRASGGEARQDDFLLLEVIEAAYQNTKANADLVAACSQFVEAYGWIGLLVASRSSSEAPANATGKNETVQA